MILKLHFSFSDLFRSMFRPSSEIDGFDDEDTMMSNMTTACKNKTERCHVLLTVSFTNLENDGKSLPKTIKYTIRDTSELPGELHDTTSLFPQPPSVTPRPMSFPGMFQQSPWCVASWVYVAYK